MVNYSIIPGNEWSLTTGNTVVSYNTTVDGTTIIDTAGVLSASGTTSGGQNSKVTTITTGASYTVLKTDYYVIVDKVTGSATSILLPATPVTGQTFIIKDGKGDATTNNITITPNSGTIDGSSNFVMNINYQSVNLAYNGSNWSLV